ncbi:type II secretion system minor pseudopilin GspJ [Psychrobacter sp. FME5]|uniref:type II secretion system minor pseudopilin GspJ n=1 Tax=Psychrobacter sp. FME5 TaxID=2487706 RepID=UPI001787DD04|nr:type II secretion system minor pseudopilin GspJ [Psychrobacter sp. FME5]MBE0444232.1 type II secretion system minor pseudopilin GspJ [Psychrobacter sp. FME5]
MKSSYGFTLLELMVAMAIFAMLAVAGWQVFDGVNRARERAQFHADNVAALQYAYLQLQQDMGQIIPYQAPNTQNTSSSNSSINNTTNANVNNSTPANEVEPEPFMRLDSEHVSFVRFADPDPRYQSSASVQHIEYVFIDERLIRRQYTSIDSGRDSVSLDSVLLEGVTAGRWQAYLPELSKKFPDTDSTNNVNGTNRTTGQMANKTNATPEVVLIPKGVAVSFTYQDMPIVWQWALAPQPLPNISQDNVNNATNNPSGSNSNSNNNGTSNGNVENNNSGNTIENVPFGQ